MGRLVKIVACYGVRHEPQWLVDDLRENLSWVDDFVEIDDRDRPKDDLWIKETDLYHRQRVAALGLGADFILVTAPDERWSPYAGKVIREACQLALDEGANRLFKFNVVDMYSPTEFRVDGHWGRHFQFRVAPPRPELLSDPRDLHASPVAFDKFAQRVVLPVTVFHLKHIEERNRANRAEIFERIDPKHEFSVLGYEYLAETEGMELMEVPEGEMFSPLYDRPYFFEPF